MIDIFEGYGAHVYRTRRRSKTGLTKGAFGSPGNRLIGGPVTGKWPLLRKKQK